MAEDKDDRVQVTFYTTGVMKRRWDSTLGSRGLKTTHVLAAFMERYVEDAGQDSGNNMGMGEDIVLRNRKSEIPIKDNEVEWVERLLRVLRSGRQTIIDAAHSGLVAFDQSVKGRQQQHGKNDTEAFEGSPGQTGKPPPRGHRDPRPS